MYKMLVLRFTMVTGMLLSSLDLIGEFDIGEQVKP